MEIRRRAASHDEAYTRSPAAKAVVRQWVGVAAVALGLGFTGWARVHLGRLWSGTVTLKAHHTIIRTGPYRLTRHPIYTGLLLALVGTTMVRSTPSAVAGLILLVLGLLLKIRQEERLLTGHFGAAYRAYQAEVPMVVPRPWRRGSAGLEHDR